MSGSRVQCPTCNAELTIPAAPPQPPAPQQPQQPELAAQIARIEALGVTYRPPKELWEGAPDEAETADEFLWESTELPELIEGMEADGEITREPDAAELRRIHQRLFDMIFDEEFGATQDDLKALIIATLPEIRG